MMLSLEGWCTGKKKKDFNLRTPLTSLLISEHKAVLGYTGKWENTGELTRNLKDRLWKDLSVEKLL